MTLNVSLLCHHVHAGGPLTHLTNSAILRSILIPVILYPYNYLFFKTVYFILLVVAIAAKLGTKNTNNITIVLNIYPQIAVPISAIVSGYFKVF